MKTGMTSGNLLVALLLGLLGATGGVALESPATPHGDAAAGIRTGLTDVPGVEKARAVGVDLGHEGVPAAVEGQVRPHRNGKGRLGGVGVAGDVPAAGSIHGDSPGSGAAAPTPTNEVLSERFDDLRKRNEILSERFDGLRRRQDDFNNVLNLVLWPLAILTGILAAGGLIGIVFSFRNEARSGQAHDLFVGRESSQQARTEDVHTVLLEASQKTLNLVNDTLELARDASDRAAKQLSQRAEKVRDEISEEATDLFIQAHYHEEFGSRLLRIVVEEPGIRNEVLDLAQRLASIEGYLEFQEIQMTAPAFLVKGMAHHLRQDESRAIKFLARAAEKRDVNPKLTQFAYFWMGYACNNVGRYTQAAEVFAIAKRFADEGAPLAFELSRMEEESRFFDLARRFFAGDSQVQAEVRLEAGRVVPRLRQLEADATKAEAIGVAQAIATTQGNICTWLARTSSDDTNREGFLDQANDHFGRGGATLWAKFGLLEARRERDPGSPPAREEYAELERSANLLSQKRAEPRSLALLYLTTVLCMQRQAKPSTEVDGVMRLLRKAFADVDDSLTLYSQHWKANVPKKRFETDDLTTISMAGRPSTTGDEVPSTKSEGKEVRR